MDWPKSGRVEATNPRSQRKRAGNKGEVSTPRNGKRCKGQKPMEPKTEQTKKNESPKVRDVTLELGSALGSSYENKSNRVAKLVVADFSRSKIELS
jgi:hypothetical protein